MSAVENVLEKVGNLRDEIEEEAAAVERNVNFVGGGLGSKTATSLVENAVGFAPDTDLKWWVGLGRWADKRWGRTASFFVLMGIGTLAALLLATFLAILMGDAMWLAFGAIVGPGIAFWIWLSYFTLPPFHRVRRLESTLSLDDVVVVFESADLEIQEAAMSAIVKWGTAAVPILSEGLRHRHPSVRERCATTLGRLGNDAAHAITDLRDCAERERSRILRVRRVIDAAEKAIVAITRAALCPPTN